MLGDKKKIELIRKITKENDISSYQIGENTSVSNKTAYNILNDDNISPRTKTLNIILEYLENTIVGTQNKYELKEEFQSKAAEESPPYKLSLEEKLKTIEDTQQNLLHQLDIITTALSKSLLNQEEIKEIIKKRLKKRN